ncbi:hypothetical protein BCR43DRAFT_446537 [Syncephalastrum racemosum]|uniref:DUF1308 domain-containing protein n=1 Tax=Syncephalastrum racemosum TaxID=13706 RepID=A0A1X2H1W8_SYNRA|nr:hypothetical protein BCR43DRAFT_446537 [Syncephalastrum racemosum]
MSRAALMRNRSVKVDLVAEQGLAWIKVIARNAKALRHDMAGLEFGEDSDNEGGLVYDDDDKEEEDDDGELTAEDAFDQLPIFKKARDYLRSAEAHQVHFRAPRVVFAFKRLHPKETENVNQILDRLRDMGIVVYIQGRGTLLDAYGGPLAPEQGCLSTQKVNLDVSTVLALISEMSHHPCRPDQVEGEALQLQAEREATSAVLPVLHGLLHDKSLFMVQTAYDRLTKIVQVVGGDREKMRFRYLFERQGDSHGLEKYHISVVPDAPSERFRRLLEPPPQKEKLNNGRKIRSRFSEFHAVIFGTGDTNRMTTVTAIQWMQTALTDAGLTGVAILCHEPRSLSEQKMTV